MVSKLHTDLISNEKLYMGLGEPDQKNKEGPILEYSTHTGQLMKSKYFQVNNKAKIVHMQISPDNLTLLTMDSKGFIQLYDSQTKLVKRQFSLYDFEYVSYIRPVAIANEFKILYMPSAKLQILAKWNLMTGEMIKRIKYKVSVTNCDRQKYMFISINDMAIDKTQTKLVLGFTSGELQILSIKTDEMLQCFEPEFQYEIKVMKLDTDDRFLYVGYGNRGVFKWCFQTCQLVQNLVEPESDNIEEDSSDIYSRDTYEQSDSDDIDDFAHSNIGSMDMADRNSINKSVYIGDTNSGQKKWDYKTDKLMKNFDQIYHKRQVVIKILFTKDNKFMLTINHNGHVKQWNIKRDLVVKSFNYYKNQNFLYSSAIIV